MDSIGSLTDTRTAAANEGPSFKRRLIDGFTSFAEHATDCAAGVGSGLGPVNIPPGFENDRTHALCKALGATAGLVGDAFIGATGAIEMGGGAAISTTGVGAVVGVPAVAVGAAQITVATAGAAIHSKNLSSAIHEMRGAENASGRTSGGSAQSSEQVREHKSLEGARNKALDEAGNLGHDKRPTTGRLHEAKDKVNGFQSADGKRGFRIDWDEKKGVHYNWYDWTKGGKGSGGRWGAEVFAGDKSTYVKLLETLQR